MREYFPKPKHLEANVKVELDLSNYAAKADIKNATGVDASSFPKRTILADLNWINQILIDVDKLDIDKLKNVPSNISNSKAKYLSQMLINLTCSC